MFIPPFNAILKALGTTRDGIKEKKEITVPVDFLKLLLGIAVKNGDFNEQGYIKLNKDVADAIASGKLSDAFQHYVAYGYFEERLGACPDVNEQWYREVNLDVNAAILAGQIESAERHYLQAGYAEFRAPSPAVLGDCNAWKSALVKPETDSSNFDIPKSKTEVKSKREAGFVAEKKMERERKLNSI